MSGMKCRSQNTRRIDLKHFLLSAAVVIGAALSFPAQTSKANAALESEIRKLDMAHAEAILKKDTAALTKLLADDATTNHPTNKIVKEREGIFDLIRAGTINYSTFVREQEEFLFYKNMVVVMGNETLTMADTGKTIKRRYTNVWMKRKGEWKLSVRHAHIVCNN